MPSIRDVIIQKKESDRMFENAIIVIRCKLVGVDDVESAVVDGRPGYVWARRYNDTYGVFQVFNGNAVNPIVNVPVLVELSDGDHKYKVVGIDTMLVDSDTYDSDTGTDIYLKHAYAHEWPSTEPGTDAMSIYIRALVPFKTIAYSGMTVSVIESNYTYEGKSRLYTTAYYNLSSYVPAAGYVLLVLIAIDPSVPTMKFILSDAVLSTLTPITPSIPPGYIPSSYIELTGGMTEIRDAQITDSRIIIHAPNVNKQEILSLINDLERELTFHQVYGGEV